MTPGAQVAAAIEILTAFETGERPADELVAEYFRHRRYIGAKDRAQIAGYTYALLRRRASLDWWIRRLDTEPGARTRMFALLVLIEGWPAEAVARACDGERFRPPPPTRAEERLLRGLQGHTVDHPQMPRWVANDLPEWLEPHFARAFGRDFGREVAAFNRPAPMDLRVNTLKADREAALAALTAEGVAAEPTPWSPVGIRVAGRAPLSGLAAFRDGLVEVQDEGSQLVALLADARPGLRVVDFCAGAGGKTLAMAAAMRNRGRLVACDVSARRLAQARPRLRRAGIDNAECRVLAREHDQWVKRHAKSFDRVLVDAPCLGTGTWRRNPGEKWRVTPDRLADLLPRQQQILRNAARLVRPGGRLVYATCSVLCEENEDQAAAFHAAEPDFTMVPISEIWPDTVGGIPPERDRCLRLTPARHATDAFFVAVFERQPDMSPSPRVEPETT